MTAGGRASWLAAGALAINAFVWGVSWWPFRQLEAAGLHPLWSTVLVYGLSVVVITLARPRAWAQLATTPVLWVLVLASGTTNATFNWAMTIGDVVRVVLLFYLMPLWAVLLARPLLGERITAAALLRVALALAGAATVLWPADGGGWPWPRSLPDWLSVAGGFSFALNNIMLRREAQRSEESRALAMFLGGAAVSAALAAGGMAPPPPALQAGWMGGALLLGLAFLGGNLALQYGASRLPANVTAVVMITEVLFATASSVLLGAGVLDARQITGGALILAATLLAATGGGEGAATGTRPAPAGPAA